MGGVHALHLNPQEEDYSSTGHRQLLLPPLEKTESALYSICIVKTLIKDTDIHTVIVLLNGKSVENYVGMSNRKIEIIIDLTIVKYVFSRLPLTFFRRGITDNVKFSFIATAVTAGTSFLAQIKHKLDIVLKNKRPIKRQKKKEERNNN